METISNATVTKCQRCGEWTNYADDAHYKAREAEKERLRGLCSWAAGRLLDAGDVEGHEKVLAALDGKQPQEGE